MRTLTVNFKIITQAEGDENLSEVIAYVLKGMAEHPQICNGNYASGDKFSFEHTIAGRKDVFVYQLIGPVDQPAGRLVDYPPQTFKAEVTATYENVYDPPLPGSLR